jgi:hypothetical protein
VKVVAQHVRSPRSIIHQGPILRPSTGEFDGGGAAFACAFVDQDDPDTTYLYYSGAADVRWTHSAIGLAVSKDGRQFRKTDELNPVIDGNGDQFNSKQSVTPAVVRVSNHYYMFFAAARDSILTPHRRIGVAYADDPQGPWTVLRVIASPELVWEGWSIDLGPSIVKLSEDQLLVYYSNVLNRLPFKQWFPVLPKYLRRRIGVLNVKIRSPSSITAEKYADNPLQQLNGPKGSPAESLFCPGHLLVGGRHVLLPSMSTYSAGYPYCQYVGMVSDNNPYFGDSKSVSVLLNGPAEKGEILNAKGQIALDTPSPMRRNQKVYLYYSAMDRQDRIWKTALSIIDYSLFEQF